MLHVLKPAKGWPIWVFKPEVHQRFIDVVECFLHVKQPNHDTGVKARASDFLGVAGIDFRVEP